MSKSGQSRILLAGMAAALSTALRGSGFRVDAALSLAAISLVDCDEPPDLVIVGLHDFTTFGDGAVEKISFLAGGARLAILCEKPDLPMPENAPILVASGIEMLYLSELSSGVLAARISRVIASHRMNDLLVAAQHESRKTRFLEDELSMQSDVLRRQQTLNWEILSNISAGVLIVDQEGCILFANGTAVELVCNSQNAIGRFYAEVLAREVQRPIDAALNAPETGSDLRCRVKSGAKHLALQICSLREEPEVLRGILVFISDETGEILRDSRMATAEKLATLGTAFSGVAHELRNPLSIIATQALSGLKHLDNQEKLVAVFDSVRKHAERCASVTNAMLELASSNPAVPVYHSLAELIEESLRIVGFKSEAQRIAFVNTVSPDFRIYADRNRTRQILVNMIVNAVDATTSGGTVSIAAVRDKARIVVSVEDTGPGIDPAAAPFVFDPFYTTKDPGSGTGMGLSLAAKMIGDCGGSIWFESKPGKTVFFAAFPAERIV